MNLHAVPMPVDPQPGLPVANLFGQHGPRCPVCSGLGHVLKPRVGAFEGPAMAGMCRSTSTCFCGGTGIDPFWVQRQKEEALHKRLSSLESQVSELLAFKSQWKPPNIVNSRQYWMETIAWATADATAVHTTTTETILFPNVTIPANYMADGRALRLRAFGKLSTTVTPTMTWALRHGGVAGTLLATTEAITMGSTVTNVNWAAELLIQTRANGSSGSLLVMGELSVHTAAGTVLSNVWGVSGFDAPAAVTVDLTADWALSFTGDWSASSASNTITGMMYYLESMN